MMINNETLQTKNLSTQLSLTTNQRNPGCLVIAGNTGNVVCNTSSPTLISGRSPCTCVAACFLLLIWLKMSASM